MEWRNYIVANEHAFSGKPTIKDTNILVEHVISLVAQGWTEQRILQKYTRLTQESLEAVFLYIDSLKDVFLLTDAWFCPIF